MNDYFEPGQVHHVVSCSRVFHVVAMPTGVGDEHIAWCLEFPTLTRTAASKPAAIVALTSHIDTVYREEGRTKHRQDDQRDEHREEDAA
jgi:hypothetical protein